MGKTEIDTGVMAAARGHTAAGSPGARACRKAFPTNAIHPSVNTGTIFVVTMPDGIHFFEVVKKNGSHLTKSEKSVYLLGLPTEKTTVTVSPTTTHTYTTPITGSMDGKIRTARIFKGYPAIGKVLLAPWNGQPKVHILNCD